MEVSEADKAKSPEVLSDRIVLLVISGGLIIILLTIIVGLFITPRALPNWAENVLVSVATASALKLGDCLATLVALAGGRQVERLGTQLAGSTPSVDAGLNQSNKEPTEVIVKNTDAEAVPVDAGPAKDEGDRL
jgi:hypothetical protein